MNPVRIAAILAFTLMAAACRPTAPQEPVQTVSDDGVDPFEIAWTDRSFHEQAWLSGSYDPAIDLSTASDYRMDVFIDEDFQSVSGRQRVHYTNNESQPLDRLYVRLFPNLAGGEAGVSAVRVDGRAVEPVYEARRSAIMLTLGENLSPGESLVVELEFSTTIPREMEGNYGLFGYFDGFLVLDTFYPMIPVYDDQGWQREATPPNGDPTYNDISFYLVRVHAPAGLSILATGTEIDRRLVDDEQIVTFASGPARDFYIAVSEDLELLEANVGETVVRSYAPARFSEHSRLVLEGGVAALNAFERRFGEYPYTEMELVSTPMQALGIEYPGLMAMNLDMYDPGASIAGVPSSIYLESTVAHEVAHQWFYNLVGNDQVQEPWLDEAFAQYATYLYYLDTYGEAAAASYQQSWSQRWDRTERAEIPIGLPAGEYRGAEYSAIVYGRGPLFLAEVARQLGDESMQALLRQYVESHAWGIASGESFRLLLEDECACEMDALFADWVDRDQ
jgi:aminopeptidase N